MISNYSKTTLSLLTFIITIIVIAGCSNTVAKSLPMLSNSGVVVVLNGRGEVDSLKYKCDSCKEVLKSQKIFDTIISIASLEAKSILKNRLSFRPISVDLQIIRRD